MTPVWVRPWMAWLLVLGLVALFAGVQTLRLADERTAHQTTIARHAQVLQELERQAREAVEAARAEEQRRAQALQEVIYEAEEKLARSRADAAAASDAGDRLRERITELTAACRVGSGNPAAPGSSQATNSTADLLAIVQRRLDAAAEGIARFADAAHAAGAACQNAHGTLTTPTLGR